MIFTCESPTIRLGTARLARIAADALLFSGVWAALVSGAVLGAERIKLNFNPDWKFIKADPAGARAGLRRLRLDERLGAAHVQRR